jgi:hypothetical protein
VCIKTNGHKTKAFQNPQPILSKNPIGKRDIWLIKINVQWTSNFILYLPNFLDRNLIMIMDGGNEWRRKRNYFFSQKIINHKEFNKTDGKSFGWIENASTYKIR